MSKEAASGVDDIVASGEALSMVGGGRDAACARSAFLSSAALAIRRSHARSAAHARPCPEQVAAWLGVSDVDAVMEQEGLNPEYEMGRQQGLGLGAKRLPPSKVRHQRHGRCPPCSLAVGRRRELGPTVPRLGLLQATGGLAGVEQRLKGKLKRSREQLLEEEARLRLDTQPAGRRGFGAKHGLGATRKHDVPAARAQQERQPAGTAGAQQQDGSGRADGEGSDEEEGRGRAFGEGKPAGHKPAAFSRSDLLKVSSMPQGKKKKKKRKSGTEQPLPASV